MSTPTTQTASSLTQQLYSQLPTGETMAHTAITVGAGLATGGVGAAAVGLAYQFIVKPHAYEAINYLTHKTLQILLSNKRHSTVANYTASAINTTLHGAVNGAMATQGFVYGAVTGTAGLLAGQGAVHTANYLQDKAEVPHNSYGRRAINFAVGGLAGYGGAKLAGQAMEFITASPEQADAQTVKKTVDEHIKPPVKNVDSNNVVTNNDKFVDALDNQPWAKPSNKEGLKDTIKLQQADLRGDDKFGANNPKAWASRQLLSVEDSTLLLRETRQTDPISCLNLKTNGDRIWFIPLSNGMIGVNNSVSTAPVKISNSGCLPIVQLPFLPKFLRGNNHSLSEEVNCSDGSIGVRYVHGRTCSNTGGCIRDDPIALNMSSCIPPDSVAYNCTFASAYVASDKTLPIQISSITNTTVNQALISNNPNILVTDDSGRLVRWFEFIAQLRAIYPNARCTGQYNDKPNAEFLTAEDHLTAFNRTPTAPDKPINCTTQQTPVTYGTVVTLANLEESFLRSLDSVEFANDFLVSDGTNYTTWESITANFDIEVRGPGRCQDRSLNWYGVTGDSLQISFDNAMKVLPIASNDCSYSIESIPFSAEPITSLELASKYAFVTPSVGTVGLNVNSLQVVSVGNTFYRFNEFYQLLPENKHCDRVPNNHNVTLVALKGITEPDIDAAFAVRAASLTGDCTYAVDECPLSETLSVQNIEQLFASYPLNGNRGLNISFDQLVEYQGNIFEWREVQGLLPTNLQCQSIRQNLDALDDDVHAFIGVTQADITQAFDQLARNAGSKSCAHVIDNANLADTDILSPIDLHILFLRYPATGNSGLYINPNVKISYNSRTYSFSTLQPYLSKSKQCNQAVNSDGLQPYNYKGLTAEELFSALYKASVAFGLNDCSDTIDRLTYLNQTNLTAIPASDFTEIFANYPLLGNKGLAIDVDQFVEHNGTNYKWGQLEKYLQKKRCWPLPNEYESTVSETEYKGVDSGDIIGAIYKVNLPKNLHIGAVFGLTIFGSILTACSGLTILGVYINNRKKAELALSKLQGVVRLRDRNIKLTKAEAKVFLLKYKQLTEANIDNITSEVKLLRRASPPLPFSMSMTETAIEMNDSMHPSAQALNITTPTPNESQTEGDSARNNNATNNVTSNPTLSVPAYAGVIARPKAIDVSRERALPSPQLAASTKKGDKVNVHVADWSSLSTSKYSETVIEVEEEQFIAESSDGKVHKFGTTIEQKF